MIEIAAGIGNYDYSVYRALLVGAVYAFTWLLLIMVVPPTTVVRAILLGALSPLIAAGVSVIGIGFIPMMLYWWYIFVPGGVITGLAIRYVTRMRQGNGRRWDSA